ncbi:hypothetical protein CCMSSC00406_0004583 [Pleurotus cornucopiae]|uniref:Uncharacterized protein n=1 Tax=Pleurotus cornucopiae TaxID=5321 RepID=A0ACB7IYL3_PLECO|nr:hypothetical protein CCMSSC00406_0004583 [Pleurotus cornucopiae]
MSRPMPRLILVRHGETEWSLNGRHTGRSDIPLTARGEESVKKQATILVGEGKLIDPSNLCTVYVSPRQRAHKTFHLLFDGLPKLPHHVISEDCRGEGVEEMQARVDGVIANVREYHRQYHEEGLNTRDVVIVAHGHFNRVLISRWINFPLCLGTHFNVEPGGVEPFLSVKAADTDTNQPTYL